MWFINNYYITLSYACNDELVEIQICNQKSARVRNSCKHDGN